MWLARIPSSIGIDQLGLAVFYAKRMLFVKQNPLLEKRAMAEVLFGHPVSEKTSLTIYCLWEMVSQ